MSNCRSTKLAVPQFPFDWKKHFVPEVDSSDCVPACVTMCARYWIDKKAISLPSDLTDWKSYFEKLKVHSHRGTNVNLLENALKKITAKGKVGLRLRTFHVSHLADVTKLFEVKPEIPVILRYDRSMTLRNVVGQDHASLLYSVETTLKERVKVIDPAFPERDTPSTYNIDDFIRGWEQTGKEIIIAYPSTMRVPINMRQKDKFTPIDHYRGAGVF